ncbi:uncharacterized protein [Penaeus vannamei]|uniref:uncharacterized protein n=1 Tax=Penaeus vannamei TaxID=6689 RepID=UPI00387F7FE9
MPGLDCALCSTSLPIRSRTHAASSMIEMITFVVSRTSGRQVYLIYDDIFTGIAAVVRKCNDIWADVISMTFEFAISKLEAILKSRNYVQGIRTFILICNPKHIEKLFEQVRNQALESTTVQWVVLNEQENVPGEDFPETLRTLLREGTQVTLIEMSPDGKANLSSSRVDRDSIIRFHKVGTWWTNQVEGAEAYMTSPLFPDIETLYSDLQGRELTVTANDNWPFFKINKYENGTVVPGAGVDPTVVDALSSKFNFTVPGKVLARILLRHIRDHLRHHRPEQSGFTPGVRYSALGITLGDPETERNSNKYY